MRVLRFHVAVEGCHFKILHKQLNVTVIIPWDSKWPKDVDGDLHVKYLYAKVNCRYNIDSRYTVFTFTPCFGVAEKNCCWQRFHWPMSFLLAGHLMKTFSCEGSRGDEQIKY
jgi:hypothetical protein